MRKSKEELNEIWKVLLPNEHNFENVPFKYNVVINGKEMIACFRKLKDAIEYKEHKIKQALYNPKNKI